MLYEEKFEIINSIIEDRQHLFIDVDYFDFIDAIILSDNITKYLGLSTYKVRKFSKLVFPDKTEKGKFINFILARADLKVCRKCDSYLSTEKFRPNSTTFDGINSHCKQCQSVETAKTQAGRQAKYNASKINRTPKWADLAKIKEFYDSCPPGYHVDHIIPLNGKNVSGLHVETNLQYLLAIDNIRKSNKFN